MSTPTVTISYADKAKFYEDLRREIEAYADPIWYTALANAAACLNQHLPRLNWVGFYLMRRGELVLGPFQGHPACTRIAIGRGVCGTAAAKRQSMLVPDVDAFPGHIVCDSASKSEVVIPLINASGVVIGVLDLDSPDLARFDEADQRGLELIVATLLQSTSLPAEF